MRRALVSLLAAGLLAGVVVAPVTARTRPSLTITFCYNTSGPETGYGLYTVTWANESPSQTVAADMTVTWTSGKGGKLTDSVSGTFPAPFPDNYYTNLLRQPFTDAPDWNVFKSVSVNFTGAFQDSAIVRQPKGGWGGPVPGQATANCT
jgi:hypothetical protein